MQGGHWCRRKCDASSSLCQTLLQSVNGNWNAHRTTKMQNQAYSLQQNQHSSTQCSGHSYHLEGQGNKESQQMNTTFYVADTPGPAILELPSYSRLRIVNLNCSVQLRKHGQPIKTCRERENVKQDLKNLKAINSKDYIIKAYPD